MEGKCGEREYCMDRGCFRYGGIVFHQANLMSVEEYTRFVQMSEGSWICNLTTVLDIVKLNPITEIRAKK